MSKRTLHGLLGFALAGSALACSLIVGTDELDEGCADGKKFCDGTCVAIDDPTYGCTPDQCTPCERDQFGNILGDRAVPRCNDQNRCVADTCRFGWGCDDCSARILTDPANCGRCRRLCSDDQTCSLGECVGAGGAGGAGGS